MTRIIAGFAGSIRLAVPPSGTRPTSDRVREAIFSALEAREALAGRRVLDLYAGSGSLGLEAASRGAAHVTLVDRATAAQRVLRENAGRIRSAAAPRDAPEIVVSPQTVRAFLGAGATTWDLVFLDPPYDFGATDVRHDLEALVARLAPGATVVLERSSRDPAPALPVGLALERRKDYGDTALYWIEPDVDAVAQPAAPFQSA